MWGQPSERGYWHSEICVVHIKLRHMPSFVLMTLLSGNKTALEILIYESLAYKRY